MNQEQRDTLLARAQAHYKADMLHMSAKRIGMLDDSHKRVAGGAA